MRTSRKRNAGRRTGWALAVTAVSLSGVQGAWGSPPPLVTPPLNPSEEGSTTEAGFLGNLEKSNTMLGDLFGLRTWLARYGVSLDIQETSEVLANPVGGAREGAAYDGLTQAVLQLDTERAFGLHGGLFNISALQIHGRNLSAENLLTLQTSSGIEADRATRLWELWYDQKFLPDDRLDIKVGEQSLDTEFMVTANGAYFLNTMFGWALVPSVDLPGGGPAYPMAALGLRVRYRPIDPITILAGIFNGSPASPPIGDSQMVNDSGAQFPTGNHRLYIAELQYSDPSVGAMVYPGEGAPLGRTYKIGVWYDGEAFADQRYDTNGVSLAAPTSNGTPLRHRGDYSIYGVADQMVWRAPGDPNRSVSIFGRAMGTPQANRNLVDFSLNAGIVLHEPIINRADDTLGFGMGFAHVSSSVSGADQDAAFYGQQATATNMIFPIRSTETYVEAVYQYQVHPWWQLQPDIQYIFNPGGGIANPYDPSKRVPDALVLGLRTTVLF